MLFYAVLAADTFSKKYLKKCNHKYVFLFILLSL